VKRKGPRRKHTPGKHPQVVTKRLRKYYGWADNTRHEIQINAELTGRAKLEAMVHEWLHLRSWALPEDQVRKHSRDLVAFLHRNNVRIIEAGNTALEF
jgi:hypothetical protein